MLDELREEEIVNKVGGRFKLSTLIQKRLVALNAGSRALVEAAGVIRGSARETDVVARFGGDEFAIVLPDTGTEGALGVGDRVRDRVRQFVFLAADGLDVRLTVSVGVATLPDAATSAEELVRAADIAMYRVKESGKDGVAVANP